MNFNNFTIKSQEAVQQAQQIAESYSHQQIENAHLLKAMLEVDDNVIPFLLQKTGINLSIVAKTLSSILDSFPKVTGGELMLSRKANKTLLGANTIAKKMKDEYVTLEHILLGILESGGKTAQLLKDSGLTKKALLAAITEIRKGSNVHSQSAEDTYNSLKKYAKNLNELAKTGKLDPVIGRDEEIRRILQILSRRTKNNPLYVGDPGVGKTAIAEGLALHITEGNVPDVLKKSTI